MATQDPAPPTANNRPLVVGAIILIVGLIALLLWQSGAQDQRGATPELATDTAIDEPAATQASGGATVPTQASEASETPVPTPTPEPPKQVSDLPPIAYEDLPPEAHDTIELIDQDGPFPYDKDGATFQNREGILPDKRDGYYSEYTVITPGSDDRGARRIVAGDDGEMYYTDDHYASFQEVIR